MSDNPVEFADQPSIQPEISNQPKKNALRGVLIEILQTLLLAFVLYFAIDAVFARVRVINISMQPTFYEGDVLPGKQTGL